MEASISRFQCSDFVARLDRNDTRLLGAGVRRVDGDADGALLRAAVAEHAANVNVAEAVRAGEFRDQRAGGDTYAEASSLHSTLPSLHGWCTTHSTTSYPSRTSCGPCSHARVPNEAPLPRTSTFSTA